MRRGSFRQITNVSLWETIPRSLATTFITLLPIVVAPRLRRRDAERLRLRAAHRHRLRCLLLDLRRRAAARLDQGARARVGAPQARGRRGDPVRRRHDARREPDAPGGGCGAPRARAARPAPAADAGAGVAGARAPARPPLEPPARPRPLAPRTRRRRDDALGTDVRCGARTYTVPWTGTARRPRTRARSSSSSSPGLGWLSLTAEAADDDRRRPRAARSASSPPRCARPSGRRFASWRRDSETLGVDPVGGVRRARSSASGSSGARRRTISPSALAQLEHRVRLLEKPEA